MDETIKAKMINKVKLNIIFSQPRFWTATLFIRFDLDSVSPLDWRNIRTERVIEMMI